MLDVGDTAENVAACRPASEHGAFPQVGLVGMLENGTRVLTGVKLGASPRPSARWRARRSGPAPLNKECLHGVRDSLVTQPVIVMIIVLTKERGPLLQAYLECLSRVDHRNTGLAQE